MRRWIIVLVAALIVAVAIISVSQIHPQKRTIAVISFVEHPVLNKIEHAFRARLAELIGTDNYSVVTTTAQGRMENLPPIARQLLRQNPDVLVAISTPVAQAVMREADADQKLIYTFVTNPGDLGDELTRTNSTGLSDAVNYAANLELMRRVFGARVKLGMAFNPNEPNSVSGVKTLEKLIEGSDTTLIKATVPLESDIPQVIRTLAINADVIYVGGDNTTVGAIGAVVSAAASQHKAVFASDSGSVESGAIAGISVNYDELGYQTAEVVRQVLAGRAPRTIPRVTVPGDRLIVNVQAAQHIGFSIPPWLLEEADEVIELPHR